MWYIYLLFNPTTNRTYIGASTNVARRLRQHRGEIKGGARATSKNRESWELVCYLSGFQDRREAYRWEKIVKVRTRGIVERRMAFVAVSKGRCPEDRKRPHLMHHPVPSGIEIHFVLKVSPKSADKANGGTL